MVPKMETNLSNTVEIFQHHQPKIPPFSWGSKKVIRSRKVNCSAIFKTNPTDRGMCCTFNALAAEEIYRWPASCSAFTCFILCTIFMQVNIQLKWLMHPESRSSPSLLQICKKKMFATPSKIHLGCLKGEQQSILIPIGFRIQVLFHTGGGNQGMNQDLKLVSVFKALVLQAYFSTVLDLFTNNIPLAEEVDCTVT